MGEGEEKEKVGEGVVEERGRGERKGWRRDEGEERGRRGEGEGLERTYRCNDTQNCASCLQFGGKKHDSLISNLLFLQKGGK